MVKCQVYVDDYIIVAAQDRITDHTDMVVSTLEDLGFIINRDKSELIPATTRTYIGFELNTAGDSGHPEIWVTQARVRKLRAAIRRLLAGTTCSARQLARVLGQCVSMSLAVSYGKIMLRGAYALLRTKSTWESTLCLDTETRTDLTWWLMEMDSP